MLLLLSPAKSLDFESPLPASCAAQTTRPRFMPQASQLIDILRALSPAQLRALMGLSDELAVLNHRRYRQWRPSVSAARTRPAALAFAGEVYRGLRAVTFDERQWRLAQQQLRILSGLYGVLRPLDLIRPHRLEMGTRLAHAQGADLVSFWGSQLAQRLELDLRGHAHKVVVNLASQEYARAVDRRALKATVIDCVFEQGSGDAARVVGVFAKRARGLMARYVIEAGIDDPDGLDGFAVEGYAFVPSASSTTRRVFRRAEGQA